MTRRACLALLDADAAHDRIATALLAALLMLKIKRGKL